MVSKFCSILAVLSVVSAPALASERVPNPLKAGETWEYLREDVMGEAAITKSDALFSVEAPYRAHDAATVPILLTQTDPDTVITTATVVVDENPAPVAAVFTFSEAMAPLDFELRVRVDQYSNVRVIAETPAGFHMTGRFVKASGGCSAPATKDAVAAIAAMGQMKLREFGSEAAMSTARSEAQIMIRHPNYSGLQRDQITQLFIPAHFIDSLEVYQGDDLLFTMEGGISISENPVFRFSYASNGADALRVKATDTDGNVFEKVLPKSASS
ncbi:MAG: quinoprotein dehydrogenase-associated SoxYZ-like carrier [Pseudomonadota bacterium]